MAESKKGNNQVGKKVASKAKGAAKREIKREAKKKGRGVAVQVLPVVFLFLAVLLLVFFVANLICNPENELKGGGEGEHAMGLLGFYVCEFFFGMFGFVAFIIPIVLAALAVFWKRICERGAAVAKIVLAVLTTLFASGFIHILMTLIADEEFSYNFSELYLGGASLSGGGVVGGYIGFVFYNLLKAGSVFVLGALFCVLGCYLVGLELHVYIARLGDLIKESIENRKNNPKPKVKKEKEPRHAREELSDGDDEDDREAIPAPAASKLKARKAEDDGDAIIPPDEEDAEDSDEDYRSEAPIRVFVKHGSVMRDGIRDTSAVEDTDGDIDDKVGDVRGSDADDEFEDEIKIDGRSTVIDKKTGEVRFDDEDGASEDKIVFDDEIKDELGIEQVPEDYVFPPIDLLKSGGAKAAVSDAEIESSKQALREVLESFKIKVKEISCSCGPTITRYEIKPDAGVRVRAIANLVDDISLALAKSGVRIEAPIPGKAAVGVEVPNDTRSTVFLRSLIETAEFQNHKSKIAACLGADVSGKPVVFDIEKMPHLLVAGTTGSGKSVCINTIIMSILYRARPDEVKLVLIDPKKVEFNVYKDIPHLSCRIVSDPKKAAGALNSAVNEMEKRFELIEEVGVRNITGYNELTKNDPDKPYMPRMVIIIDELADLMMTAPDEVETAICRIAQKARAAGIHLILGTQRPSVDVITGLIKANIPSRIAFTVTSSVDSRTIIDIGGAEKLIGMGDMLYAPVGSPKPKRVQGAFVSDGEVEGIVDFIKSNNAPVRYDCEFERSINEEAAKCGNPAQGKKGEGDARSSSSGDEDPKLYEAVELAIEAGKISTSLLQRKLEVGYGRAAKIIDRMEELGYVGPADGNKPRKILVTAQDLAEKRINDNSDSGIFD